MPHTHRAGIPGWCPLYKQKPASSTACVTKVVGHHRRSNPTTLFVGRPARPPTVPALQPGQAFMKLFDSRSSATMAPACAQTALKTPSSPAAGSRSWSRPTGLGGCAGLVSSRSRPEAVMTPIARARPVTAGLEASIFQKVRMAEIVLEKLRVDGGRQVRSGSTSDQVG